MTDSIELRDVAKTYYDAGLNVLPADRTKKRPLGAWKQRMKERPSFDEAFPAGIQFDALFVVCGATSGGLEVLDFDQGGLRYDAWRALNDLDLIGNLPNETTQHGGRHVAFRSKQYERNQKLASNANGVTVETRGEGGGVIVAPSEGYAMNWGSWTNIPTITPEQRAQLLDTARSLDESPEKPATARKREMAKRDATKATPVPPFSAGQSVADFLRANLEYVRDALRRAGWLSLGVNGVYEQWERPGQENKGKPGGSLCIDPNDEQYGNFHCFTSNAAPLEIEGNYSPLKLIAALEYGADESAAARAVKGSAPRPRQNAIVEVVVPYDLEPVETLTTTASGAEYSEIDDPRAACYARQMKRLKEEAEKRARRSLEEIDVEKLNESFPLEDFKEQFGPIATLTELLGKKNKTPYSVNAMVGLWAISGVLGYEKIRYSFNGKRVNPLIHVNLRGPKGSGKTDLIKAFTNPVIEEIDDLNAKKWSELEGEKVVLEAQIERAKSDQKNGNGNADKPRLKTWQDKLKVIEWGGKTIVISGETSFEAVQYEAYIEELEARIEAKSRSGRLFQVDDDTYWVDTGRNFRNENELVRRLARATQVLDVVERPAKKVTDKGRGGARAGAAWLLSGQLEHFTMVLSERCLSQGFDRRFLYGLIPDREYSEEIDLTDITPAQENWLNLAKQAENYAGGNFLCGYMDAYKKWRPKMTDRINKAKKTGDRELSAFLGTLLENTVHALALLGQTVSKLWRGEKTDAIGNDAFELATKLIDQFINMRNITWRQIKIATAKGERAPATVSTDPLDDLTPAARNVYDFLRTHGEPFGVDDRDRAATITEIVVKGRISAYRPRRKLGDGTTERERIDEELKEVGLMYIDSETDKRVALPVYTLNGNSGEVEEAKTEPVALTKKTPIPFWETDVQTQAAIDATPGHELCSERSEAGAEGREVFQQFA